MAKQIDEEKVLRVEKIVDGGTGLARDDGKIFFIYGAVPGEKVKAHIYAKRKGVFFGETLDVIESSSERIEPKCQYFGKCGGCTFQHVDYKTQLKIKRQIFTETLERLGGFQNISIDPIEPSPLEWEYRNKMEFAFGKNEDGVFLGLHRRGRFDVLLPCATECLLISVEMRQVCAAIEEMAQGEAPHDPVTGQGYLRFFVLRKSFFSGKFLLGLTVTQRVSPEIFSFWFEELDRRFPGLIAGGYLTVNNAGSSSQGEYFQLFGEPEFIEAIGERKFYVSASSFFQTNPRGAEKLYQIAAKNANLKGSEKLWDLYCGTGTIGIFLHKDSISLLGIESNMDSINDAIRNAKLNGIDTDNDNDTNRMKKSPKAKYIFGDVRKVLWEFEQNGVKSPDIIVIDPPRAGLTKKVVHRISNFAPDRIVYISCNPATLARDASMFRETGFDLVRTQPMDMFPQTYHVEGVALLKKTK